MKERTLKEILFEYHETKEITDIMKKILKKINYKKLLIYLFTFIFYYLISFLLQTKIGISKSQMRFSFSWILIIITIISLFKRKSIIFNIFNIFIFMIFLIQYFHIAILKVPFYFTELFYTKEGLKYINEVISNINFKFAFILIFLITYWVIIAKKLNKIENQNKKIIKIVKIIIILIIVILYRNSAINLLGKRSTGEVNKFHDYRSARDIYDDFTDKNRAYEITGMYEYTIRDIYLYIKFEYFSNKKKEKSEIKKYFSDNYYKIEDNKYTGIFKDKNVIFIFGESIDNWLVTEDIMPTLYNMKKNSINFTNRYAPHYGGGRTINTEYSINTGLYIPINYNIFNAFNDYYKDSLANKFNEQNYITNSIHFNTGSFYERKNMHEKYGYKNSYFIKDMYDVEYRNDADLIKNKKTYNLMVSKKKKFMTFFITYSAHLPYSYKNGFCRDLRNTTNEEYNCIKRLASYTDEAVKLLVDNLKKDNLLDDTVIVFATDHYTYGYNQKEISKIKGGLEPKYVDKVPFFIWSNGKYKDEVDTYVDTQDILPTLLNLFGIKYKSNMYIGQDIFSKYNDQYVYFSDGSYISNNKEVSIKEINQKIKINELIVKRNH